MLGPIVLIILLHRQKPIAVSENLTIEVHGAIVFLLVYFKEIFSSLCLINTSSAGDLFFFFISVFTRLRYPQTLTTCTYL